MSTLIRNLVLMIAICGLMSKSETLAAPTKVKATVVKAAGGNANGNSNGGSTSGGSTTGGSTTGGSTGNGNSGNTFDCSNNPNLCTGNNGGGNGNTGPGNQGNDGSNGNAGGGTSGGSTTGGTSTGGSTTGNSNGNSNGTTNGNSNGNANGNSNGNSNGTTNGNSNGNANGNSNGGSTNGTTSGGSTNGTTNGGSTNGTTNGGSTNGTTSGGSTNGTTNGGSTNGTTNGGSTNGTTDGGSTNGTTNGGSTNGTTNGGSTNGTTNGGSTNGTTNGGSTNGTTNGGSTNGTTNGGSTNGTTNGGSTNGTTNGGSTNGTTNGGSTNGTTNGGSTNGTTDGGSTNGTTNGGSTNGTTNGGSTNGTTNGGSTNGTTNGGSTNGTTDGGSTNGGSTNGSVNSGNTDGGSTNGNSNGGSTTGSKNDGSTNGGNTDGGSTNGSSNNGSTNGESNGGSTNGNSNGGSTNGGQTEQPKPPSRKLEATIKPLFYIDYDFMEGIVAILPGTTPAPVTPGPIAPAPAAPVGSSVSLFQAPMLEQNDKLVVMRNAPLYQKTVTERLEGGIGAAVSFYYSNATGIAAQFWAQVGLLPMKGVEITSVRYSNSLSEAQNQRGYTAAPENITDVRSMKVGENIAYKTKGGLIFTGSAGISFAGVNVTTLAQGIWEIYVEKVDSARVYVKITNSDLNALSVGAGGGFAQIGLQNFKGTDDGFSYLMNINDTDTAKVYYDFVRGNIVPAQKLAEKIATKKTIMGTPVIQKVDAFKRISKGRSATFFFGLPIVLNASTSKSKIQSFSTTDMYLEDTRVNAQFGIFDQTSSTKAFSSHTTKTRGFYGARYKSFGLKDGKVREMGEMGQFTWIAQDDSTSMRSYKNNLDQIISETGLDAVSMRMPDKYEDLGFTNITVNISLSHANTRQLFNRGRAMNKAAFVKWSEDRANYVYARKGMSLCRMPLNETQDCLTVVKNETTYAAKKMLSAIDKMAQNFNNDVEYTKAYAEFGQYALTNQITLGMALNMAGEGAEVVFATEGTLYSSRLINMRTVNTDGELKLVRSTGYDTAASLSPVYKRSRYHGIITNFTLTGLGSP